MLIPLIAFASECLATVKRNHKCRVKTAGQSQVGPTPTIAAFSSAIATKSPSTSLEPLNASGTPIGPKPTNVKSVAGTSLQPSSIATVVTIPVSSIVSMPTPLGSVSASVSATSANSMSGYPTLVQSKPAARSSLSSTVQVKSTVISTSSVVSAAVASSTLASVSLTVSTSPSQVTSAVVSSNAKSSSMKQSITSVVVPAPSGKPSVLSSSAALSTPGNLPSTASASSVSVTPISGKSTKVLPSSVTVITASSKSAASSLTSALPSSVSVTIPVSITSSAVKPSASSSVQSSTISSIVIKSTSVSSSIMPTATSVVPPTGFVKTAGTELTLDGKPFRFAGVNGYYLFYGNTEDVDAFFSDCQKIKASVVRTWLFADGENEAMNNGKKVYFQKANGGKVEYNDDPTTGLGRFDYVVESAKKHGIRLMVAMTNNWQTFGGVDWYVENFASDKTHGAFYTDATVKQTFKDYMAHVLNRKNSISGVAYKDDPTIMSVELGNEFRCQGTGKYQPGTCNEKTITTWADEMTTYLKKLSPNQLIALGDEGFLATKKQYGSAGSYISDGSSGIDFAANAALPNVDIVGLHTYMDTWGVQTFPEHNTDTVSWLKDHADIAHKIGKPIYLGEYGIKNKQERINGLKAIHQVCMENKYSGTFLWLLLSSWSGGKYPDADGYGIAVGEEAANLFVQHAQQMAAIKV